MKFLLSSLLAVPIVFLSFLVMAGLANSGSIFSSYSIFCNMGSTSPRFSHPISNTRCIHCDAYSRQLPRYLASNDTPEQQMIMADSVDIISIKDIEVSIYPQCNKKDTNCHIKETLL